MQWQGMLLYYLTPHLKRSSHCRSLRPWRNLSTDWKEKMLVSAPMDERHQKKGHPVGDVLFY